MTVTTHSPETNLFLSIPKCDKKHTPKARIVCERMHGVFMMLVCPKGDDDKRSQTYILLSAFFNFILVKQVHWSFVVISYKMKHSMENP